MPITFDVDPTKQPEEKHLSFARLPDYLEDYYNDGPTKGNLIKVTNSAPRESKYIYTHASGFVGGCCAAYNFHYELVLGPDEVWVMLMTSLSRYIDANSEKLRHIFVSHEGKIKLKVTGGGDIYSADYDGLISNISDLIDQNTKGDIREWVECNFSTSTPLKKVVSKLTLMAAMQNYFSYEIGLFCGLPKVTLLGTVKDWELICTRINKLQEFEDSTLHAWSKVLGFVMNNFVQAFKENVDKDFWNRIAHYTGGGSGPTYLEGWVLAFIGFDKEGKYFLNDINSIMQNNKFGKMDTDLIPPSMVSVPVTINDNGVEHNTKVYAGIMMPAFDGKSITPVLDWALVDMGEA